MDRYSSEHSSLQAMSFIAATLAGAGGLSDAAPAGAPPCESPGEVFFDVGSDLALDVSLTLNVTGSNGGHFLSFVSGTSLSAMASAINSISQVLGVAGEPSLSNPQRLRLHSIMGGADAFVSVRQIGDDQPHIFAQDLGGNAVFERTDYGCAFGVPACAEPAQLYLETDATLQTQGNGSVTLFISSNAGQQEFTFASGSSHGNIISAINTFEAQLGLTAEQCPKNTDRVTLRSTFVHEFAFVEVQQVGGTPPIVVPLPVGGTLSYSVLTFGESALHGDVNCDGTINTSDLLTVIEQWGTCSVMQSSCAADVTGNGAVDVDDLLFVVVRWGANA